MADDVPKERLERGENFTVIGGGCDHQIAMPERLVEYG